MCRSTATTYIYIYILYIFNKNVKIKKDSTEIFVNYKLYGNTWHDQRKYVGINISNIFGIFAVLIRLLGRL